MRALLNLIICEFAKLKRRRFLHLTLVAAVLFPIPLTVLVIKDSLPFVVLYRLMFVFAQMLLQPLVIGILAAMIFITERENETLKNLMTIPVSGTKLLLAKFIVLIALSIAYSLGGLGSTLIGGILIGGADYLGLHLVFSLLAGIFFFAVALPGITAVIALRRSFIVSVIVVFGYAVVCFSFAYSAMAHGGESIMASGAAILPVIEMMRWYLGFFPLSGELAATYTPYAVTTGHALVFMGLVTIVFTALSIIAYRKEEI